MSGIAGGADVILIPEYPLTVEETCVEIEKRHRRGKDFSIVVVSEGYKLTYASGEQREVTQEAGLDQFGHVRFGGVGESLAQEIEGRTGFETRDGARARPAGRHADRARPGAGLRASASSPPTSSTRASGVKWLPCAATTIDTSARRGGRRAEDRPRALVRRRQGLFRLVLPSPRARERQVRRELDGRRAGTSSPRQIVVSTSPVSCVCSQAS